MNKKIIFLFGMILAALLAGCSSPRAGTAAPQPTMIAATTAAAPVSPSPIPSTTPISPTATLPAAQPESSPTPQTEPTQPPLPSPTPTQVEPAAQNTAACLDAAFFLDDVTIPDFSTVERAKPFLKTWRVRNAGSCDWGSGYVLSFLSGELMSHTTSVVMPAARAGDTVDISVDMIAPDDPGGYTGNWQIVNPRGERVMFAGSPVDYMWIKVNVPGSVPAALPPTPVAVQPQTCASTADDAFAQRVVDLINQERAKAGLAALKRETRLNMAAATQVRDMSCNNFVDHYGSDGSTWFKRIQAQGYDYGYASENIAAGNPAFGGTADWVVQIQWMNSQVHRDNILNPQVTEIGVAYMFNSAAQWGGYTAVNFAKPQ